MQVGLIHYSRKCLSLCPFPSSAAGQKQPTKKMGWLGMCLGHYCLAEWILSKLAGMCRIFFMVRRYLPIKRGYQVMLGNVTGKGLVIGTQMTSWWLRLEWRKTSMWSGCFCFLLIELLAVNETYFICPENTVFTSCNFKQSFLISLITCCSLK